jgi:4-hydroxy-4-methyl-2-oxoglutarate aldolase
MLSRQQGRARIRLKRAKDSMTEEISDEWLARGRALSSATLHEAAGRAGALPHALKPLSPEMTVCGRAFPVLSPVGDNLWLHRAIAAAGSGDVIVADVGDGDAFGYWGEIMAVAARERGIEGLVITGGVRDSRRLIAMDFPVFSRSICIRGTGKDPNGIGALGAPVRIGDIDVHAGDFVFGDADGVVVLPKSRAAEIIQRSEDRDRHEATLIEALRAGKTTMEIYNLPPVDGGRA